MNDQISQAIQQLIPALATTIYTLIAVGLYQLQLWLRTKYKIDVKDATRRELERAVAAAVHYAEERARQSLKNGVTLDSETKKALAIEFAMAQQNLKKATPDVIERMILAQLGEERSWEK